MDTRNSALVVGLYLVGAVAVAGVIYYAMQRTEDVSRAEIAMQDQYNVEMPASRAARVPMPGTFAATSRPAGDLRISLALTREQLERRTHDLKRKDDECRALKAELDESFALISALLTEPPTETNKAARAKLEGDLARLQEAIAKSEAMNFQQEAELAELQEAFMQGNLELENAQESAKRELEALASEHDALDSAARRVIERAGMAAVPALVESLTDVSPGVRRWAAQCLGRIGMDAADAEPELRELLNDSDAMVRSEAQRALASIMGNELD